VRGPRIDDPVTKVLEEHAMSVSQRPRSPEGLGSPISNEAYNVLTSLQTKLEGMEVYRKYAQGQGGHLWQKLNDLDEQAVRILVDELERLVRDGGFRMRPPGQTG
jgi:hypothetical protein